MSPPSLYEQQQLTRPHNKSRAMSIKLSTSEKISALVRQARKSLAQIARIDG
jgi:hypothetical protein